MAAIPTLVRGALLLCFLAATSRALSVSDFPFNPRVVPVNYICTYLTETNAVNNTKACQLLKQMATGVLSMPDDACPEPQDTSFGRQTQPSAESSTGAPAPAPLTAVKVLPARFNQEGLHHQSKFQGVVAAEGATYNWMWQVIRNIKWYWPCSRPFGGQSAGYLVPDGWDMVGADAAAPGFPKGVYTMAERGKRYPIMVIMKQQSKRHLIVAVRGSGTQLEWARNLMYNRTSEHAFPLSSGSDAARFPGETHIGFTLGFDDLWPQLRDALEAEVAPQAGAAKPPGSRMAAVTITGHSQGAALATLLSYAAQTYLDYRKAGVKVGLIAFGSPNVGDSTFVQRLSATVNIRRVTFENDPFPMLPCASAKGAKEASMPACNNGIVPSEIADDAAAAAATLSMARHRSGRGDAPTYWSDYQPTAGEVLIKASDMPVQPDAWSYTNHLNVAVPKGSVAAVHGCSYACFLRQFSRSDSANNNCLLKQAPEGTELASKNSYCPNFPSGGADEWPVATIDRQLFTDNSAFPEAGARPPMWDFRTYADSRSWSCSVGDNNMMTIDIKHNPFPGITPEMMRWFFNNLQGSTVINGTKYPNFLLFHPRDHISWWASHPHLDSQEARRNKLSPSISMREFVATGCKETGDDHAPYVCPSSVLTPNPGVTKATKLADYTKLSIDHVNSTSVVRSLESNRIYYAVRGCSRMGCAWSVRTEHNWEEAPDGKGLLMSTRQEIGLRWKLATKHINPRIVDAWRNGVAPDKKCKRIALHYIEEYGGLQHWLPAAFQQGQKGLQSHKDQQAANYSAAVDYGQPHPRVADDGLAIDVSALGAADSNDRQ